MKVSVINKYKLFSKFANKEYYITISYVMNKDKFNITEVELNNKKIIGNITNITKQKVDIKTLIKEIISFLWVKESNEKNDKWDVFLEYREPYKEILEQKIVYNWLKYINNENEDILLIKEVLTALENRIDTLIDFSEED